MIALAVATLGFWLGDGRERDVRVHRRRRRADHRLPVRARARDAGRADGRHRPRRPARAADQGPGGARVDPPRRHRRARQDRHGDDRPDERSSTWSPTIADEALRLVGALEHASEHPIARAIATAAGELGRRGRGVHEPRGLGVEGVVDGRAVVAGRPALLPSALRPTARRAPRRRRGGARAAPRSSPAVDGEAARGLRRRRHGQADARPRPSRGCARSACARCC